jgi:predicted MPP superfamily phosphohydrolase
MLWRKRLLHGAMHRTGLWSLLDRATTHGKRIEVTRHRVAAPLAEPLTLALIADLHLARRGVLEARMLQIVRAARPDVIVVAGDVTSLDGHDGLYRDVLSGLAAPRGVWMVSGNWDYWAPMTNADAVCASAGVRRLTNQAVEIAPGIWLAGVDDAVAGAPDPEAAFRGIPEGAWVIAVFHCPVTFNDVAGRCALALAGHTHGGQVRIPGLPPLWMPAGCHPYVSGWYQCRGSRMYVSRGLAAPGIPVRTFCRPEIALFTLGGPTATR